MTEPSSSSPPPPRSRTFPQLLLILALLSVLGFITFSLAYGPTTTEPDAPDAGPAPPTRIPPTTFLDPDHLAFQPVAIDPNALDEALKPLPRHNAPLDKAATEPLLARFFELNRLEAQRASAPTRRPVETGLAIRLRELYGLTGRPGLYTLLDDTWPPFLDALHALQRHAASHTDPIEALIASPPDDLRAATDWTGGFILLARSIGLMDTRGAIPERLAPLVHALYRYRWFTTLSAWLDPKELLTLEEYRLLVLWRLHEAQGIDLRLQLQYVHEATTLIPDYPAPLAEALLYARADKKQEARQRLLLAAEDPHLADLAQRYLQLLDAPAPTP